MYCIYFFNDLKEFFPCFFNCNEQDHKNIILTDYENEFEVI